MTHVNTVEGMPPADRPLLHRMRIRLGVLLGLLYVVGPISDLADASLTTGQVAGISFGLAAFVALYWSLMPPGDWLTRHGYRWILGGVALLPVIAIALLLAGAPSSFTALFVYFVAAAGILLPAWPALGVVAATALGVGIGTALTGANSSEVATWVLTIVSIGAIMAAFGRIVRGNRELREARDELAKLAVSEERLRIARDLHDLLGHSLSVIALKSELAAKLVGQDPKRAESELADIQSVSRQALAEVRDAVEGYRTVPLTQALDGARAALSAAGIAYDVDDGDIAVPPEVESVLAWAVREGTTNVVRHSDADRVSIHVHRGRETAEVEVEDDGSARRNGSNGGSGLIGLTERAEAVRGTVEAGSRRQGGFRLRVTVPLDGK
jgi:two-component system, NarL family, sensor histidine kinase DesK